MSSQAGHSRKNSLLPGTFDPISVTREARTLCIVVPGVNTPAPREWQDGTGRSWLSNISAASKSVFAIYGYYHGLKPSVSFSWQALLNHGDQFLSALVDLIERHKVLQSYPIVIIAHSVGGFIVKQAIRGLCERISSLGQLFSCLSGIIFLGVPHSQQTTESKWEDMPLLVETTGNLPKKRQSLSQKDIDRLARTCLQFDQVSLKVPILTVFERKETKTGPFGKKFLVSKELARLKYIGEHCLGVELDHRTLCQIKIGDHKLQTIVDFVGDALDDTAERRNVTRASSQIPTTPERQTSIVDEVASPSSIASPPSFVDQTTSPISYTKPSTHRTSFSSMTRPFNIDRLDTTVDALPAFPEHGSIRKIPHLPCYIIPPLRNKQFYGRSSVLERLEEVFLTPKSTMLPNDGRLHDVETAEPTSFALAGPGGMGKTQVAAEFVHAYRDRFDAIFWLYAGQGYKLADGIAQIALRLGLISKNSADARDPVVIRDMVKGWLSDPIGYSDAFGGTTQKMASYLVVFDNAEESEELAGFWPFDGPGCVLFTSRDRGAKALLAKDGLDLGPFTIPESNEYMMQLTTKSSNISRSADGVEAVSRILGGLPLAITQMAGVIVRREMSYNDFVQTYAEFESRPELLEFPVDWGLQRTGYAHTLASVWTLDELKHGRVILHVLSFFYADGIPEHVLIKNRDKALLEDYPKTYGQYCIARAELLQWSLISKDTVEDQGQIFVHRLIQDSLHIQMSSERFNAVAAAAIALLSSVWPYRTLNSRDSFAQWREYDELAPHASRLKKLTKAGRFAKISVEGKLDLARLLSDAAWYLHSRGHHAKSVAFLKQTMSILDSLTFGEIEDEPSRNDVTRRAKSILADLNHHWGCVCLDTNDPQGSLTRLKAFNQVMIDEFSNIAQNSDQRLAMSFNELGNAYLMNDDWEEGRNCFLRSIEEMKKTTHYAAIDVSLPSINLSLAYWLEGGDLNESMKLLNETLVARQEAYGVDDQKNYITGRLLHTLGIITGARGEADTSFDYHQRALRQFKTSLGNNHHRTGDLHVKVADCLVNIREYKDAIAHYDEAIRIFHSRREAESPYIRNTARAKFKRGQAFEAINNTQEAAIDLNESLRIYQEIMPNFRGSRADLTEAMFDSVIAFWSR